MLLTIEDRRDKANATVSDVRRAVARLALSNGPTFLVLEDGERAYAQAAGTEGRFVIESRTNFGEGFQHFRARRRCGGDASPTVIHYRRHCVRHPPRRCPLHVRRSEVCSLADVQRALLAFALTGQRDDTLGWRDVTKEYVKDKPRRAGPLSGIREIRPGGVCSRDF